VAVVALVRRVQSVQCRIRQPNDAPSWGEWKVLRNREADAEVQCGPNSKVIKTRRHGPMMTAVRRIECECHAEATMRVLNGLLLCSLLFAAPLPALAEQKGPNGEKCESSATNVKHDISGKHYTCDKCVFLKCAVSGDRIDLSKCQQVTHWSNCVEVAATPPPKEPPPKATAPKDSKSKDPKDAKDSKNSKPKDPKSAKDSKDSKSSKDAKSK
jgi:hypothetical protein